MPTILTTPPAFTLALIEGLFSGPHWIILGIIALLIFGRRLPEVGRSLGKGITEFKKGLKDVGDVGDEIPSNPGTSGSTEQQLPPPQRHTSARIESPTPVTRSQQSQGVRVGRQDMVD